MIESDFDGAGPCGACPVFIGALGSWLAGELAGREARGVIARALLVLSLVAFAACGAADALEVQPNEARAGEWVVLRGPQLGEHGAVVVRFAGVPAQPVIIESDVLLRVRVPTLPPGLDGQAVDVSLTFADGTELHRQDAFKRLAGPLAVRPVEID